MFLKETKHERRLGAGSRPFNHPEKPRNIFHPPGLMEAGGRKPSAQGKKKTSRVHHSIIVLKYLAKYKSKVRI